MLLLCSDWGDATNCSLIQAEFLITESDTRGINFPCLQVLVNATESEKTLHLHYDEAALNLNPEVLKSIMQEILRASRSYQNVNSSKLAVIVKNLTILITTAVYRVPQRLCNVI